MVASFHFCGNIPCSNDRLNIKVNCGIRTKKASLSTLDDKFGIAEDLFGSMSLHIFLRSRSFVIIMSSFCSEMVP